MRIAINGDEKKMRTDTLDAIMGALYHLHAPKKVKLCRLIGSQLPTTYFVQDLDSSAPHWEKIEPDDTLLSCLIPVLPTIDALGDKYDLVEIVLAPKTAHARAAALLNGQSLRS